MENAINIPVWLFIISILLVLVLIFWLVFKLTRLSDGVDELFEVFGEFSEFVINDCHKEEREGEEKRIIETDVPRGKAKDFIEKFMKVRQRMEKTGPNGDPFAKSLKVLDGKGDA